MFKNKMMMYVLLAVVVVAAVGGVLYYKEQEKKKKAAQLKLQKKQMLHNRLRKLGLVAAVGAGGLLYYTLRPDEDDIAANTVPPLPDVPATGDGPGADEPVTAPETVGGGAR